MKRIILIILGCFIFVGGGYAQEKVIVRGKVLDAKDRLPVIGASVFETDKDGRTISGTQTDIDGNYALRMTDSKNRISVSFIGYKTYREAVNGRTSVNILLAENQSQLDQVVVTAQAAVNNGTGLNIEKRNSTTATVTIQAKDLQELASQSIDQALQGRMSGVDIGTTSGDPGAGMSIRIRGTSSINGSSNPLIVLDGLPFDTEIPSDFNFGTADENGYAQLLNIAPTDIQDITVLKDAASTAVWGSRAANGVLIINTKRGIIGKPQLTYNFKGYVSNQPKSIPLLNGNQFSTLIPEEVSNGDGNPLDIQKNKEFSYDPYDPYWYNNYSQNTNWIDAITQTGYSQDHNLSMTGGGEKARYYASLGYSNVIGTTVGTDLKRITSKINLDYTVSSRIKFRTDITFTHLDNDQNFPGDIRGVAYNKMPNMSIYEYDLNGNMSPNYFSPATNIQGSFSYDLSKNKAAGTYNPVALAMEGVNKQIGNRIIPHFFVQYDIFPSVLTSTLDVQFDINNNKQNTFLPQVATGRPNTETVVNRTGDSDGDSFGVTTKFNLVYRPKLNPEIHTFQGLLSLQTNDSRYLSYNAATANTASSLLQDPSDPSRTINSDLTLKASQGETRSVGALIQGQYQLLDKYIVNAGLRVDGNSRFGPSNRYGLFPSLSLRWRVSGENFLKKSSFINDLSLRASYGQSGGVPSKDYLYFNQYSPFDYTYAGQSGVYPSNLELSNLKWQTVTGTNLGFNFWIFNNRVLLDAEVYRNRTTDMFFDKLAIPTYTGFSQYSANVGTMDNQGWEIMLNTIPYKSKNIQVGFDFNIARNTNIIRKVSEYYPRDNNIAINQNGKYRSYLLEGNPFGSFYGFKYDGVYSTADETIARDAKGNQIIGPNGQAVQMRFGYPAIDYTFQPGDAKYEDINHDGNIDEKDVVFLGNGIPKVTGGFGPNFTYKGLKITTFFNYRLGYQVINGTNMNTTNMYYFNNQSTAVLRRWRNPGDQTDIPRALYRKGYNWLGSDRYVEDGDFVRLKSVTVRYNLPASFLNKIKMRSLSVYVTGENLITWTKYTGQDPDISTRGDNNPFTINMDNALTPPSRNLLFGLTAGF
nr:SusC/RagA family TonB-linked outer membrane protein [uncultured Pedobacter sp.]